MWKEVNGVRTYFLYDGDAPLLELREINGANRITAINLYGAPGLLGRRVLTYNESTGELLGSQTMYYQCEASGNVVHRLSDTGAILTTQLYDAYGQLMNVRDGSGQEQDPSVLAGDPYGYKGRFGYYTDHETDLILCTYRYYDPQIGRWLTRDPIGYDDGLNLYRYCGNNPGTGVDPSGLLGHHYCPRSVFLDPSYQFSSAVKSYFQSYTTGEISEYKSSPHNGYPTAHKAYVDAVRKELDCYLWSLKSQEIIQHTSDFTVAQAQSFMNRILNSNRPAIHDYNVSIWRWINEHKKPSIPPYISGGGAAAMPLPEEQEGEEGLKPDTTGDAIMVVVVAGAVYLVPVATTAAGALIIRHQVLRWLAAEAAAGGGAAASRAARELVHK